MVLRFRTGARPARRSARLSRLVGALVVMGTVLLLLGVVVPEQAAGDVVPAVELSSVEPSAVEPARTGAAAERLWLLGGLALSLTAAGVVAIAAARGRRNQ